jgi:sporulation protein YlmC with PRC-barrel domain
MRSTGGGAMIGANPAEVMLNSGAPAYESPYIDPDPHLRSATDVQDYKLFTHSEEVGKVTDFVINPENWTVTHAVVELDDDRRQVLLPTDQICKIGFPDMVLTTVMMPDSLRMSQPFEGF